MKKILLVLTTVMFLSMNLCYSATKHEAVEPEDDGAFSFSCSYHNDDNPRMLCDIFFINYAKTDGTHEYWFRFLTQQPRSKLLDSFSIVIDGKRHDITAVHNPSDKYVLAGFSLIDNKMKLSIIVDTFFTRNSFYATA